MTNKRSIVIAAAGVAVAAVLAFAVLAVGLGNGSIVKQEQKSKGNGMAEKLEFKNPVTFELIDKNGKVVSKTVAYNAITDDGRAYIYKMLGDAEAEKAVMETMAFSDVGALIHDDEGANPTLENEEAECTPAASLDNATCVATFNFADDYDPGMDGNLVLATNAFISVGVGTGEDFTPYFTISDGDDNAPSIAVHNGTTYASLRITWTITIES
ncbi:MAG: hypothetical protein QXI43_06520 [Candidatus Nitrosocaldus sp.]